MFEKAKNNSAFYRVMRNNKPLGVIIPNNMWESITEDLEALSSPNYRARIAKARKDKKSYTSAQVKKKFNL